MQIVKNDVLDIAKRIREIDYRYVVCFNEKKKRFEVHVKNRLNNSLEITGTNRLDNRLLKKVWQTRVENVQKYLKQIELENANLSIY